MRIALMISDNIQACCIVIQVIVSLAAVGAFIGLVLPAIVATTGVTGLLKFWLVPWLGYHFWMSTFTVVHHTAPHIPFKPASSWNAAKAQLSGTVHCDYPKWYIDIRKWMAVANNSHQLMKRYSFPCQLPFG